MILSAPIYRLKGRARRLARQTKIPLHKALDKIAADEGFNSWSHLAARWQTRGPAERLLATFNPGDILLLAARPGEGKTSLGLEIVARALAAGRSAFFFSSEFSFAEIQRSLDMSGYGGTAAAQGIGIELTDRLCARLVISVLSTATKPSVAVIDYLQIMDQNREDPPVGRQIETLKQFAAANGHSLVFLSQIHRSFDPVEKPLPDFADVRITNPLDLSHFNKGWFLNEGEVVLRPAPRAA